MFKKVFIQAGLEGTPTVVMVANLQEEQVSADALYVPKKVRVSVREFSVKRTISVSVFCDCPAKAYRLCLQSRLSLDKQTAGVFPASVIAILIDRLEVITPCSKISNFLSELSLVSAHRCAQMFV